MPGYGQLIYVDAGASSVVYRAVPDNGTSTVAVKVLTGSVQGGPAGLAFERELLAMEDLAGHPNIVRLLDWGTTSTDAPFVVLEYYQGGTFAGHVDAHGPLGWQQVVEVGIKLAGALESVHRSGFVHRDLKPANVFVGTDITDPILGDFGVSSFIAPGLSGSNTVTVSATPVFAAPEVLNGLRPTALSDIYSLGATLFGLVEGRPAHAAASIDVVIERVTAPKSPPRPSEAVPEAFADLLAEMMAMDPDDRPRSALVVGHRLRRLQAEVDPTTATPLLVLTDHVVTDMTSTSAAPSGGATSGGVGDGVQPVPRNAAADAPARQFGSLHEWDTADVGSFTEPTRVLPAVEAEGDHPDVARGARPSWRWPVLVAAVALVALGGYWLVTGQFLAGESVEPNGNEAAMPLLVSTLDAHDDVVEAVAWSPDGERLATAGRDGVLRIWGDATAPDPTSAQPVEVRFDSWVLDIGWAEDGSNRLAAVAADGSVVVWDGEDGLVTGSETSGVAAEAVDWEPGGSRLAVATATGRLSIWSVEDGEVAMVATMPQRDDGLLAAEWRSTGGTPARSGVVASGGKDGTVVIDEVDDGGASDDLVIAADDWIRDVQWSADGASLLVASSEPSLTVWRVATGDVESRLTLSDDPVAGVQWSADGSSVLTATDAGDVILWSPVSGEVVEVEGAGIPRTSLSLAPGGQQWAIGLADGRVEIWRVRTAAPDG